ncbi:MAG TPA: helix-turn-helix domain-containing protein [Phycisphaerae bacterium]|nr:helix-turn-helix domain-containing protein [Phycisphaerae bacterium]HOM50144.1 helix-turn-helix domain-containing protein [Phycisphaerae bacterium]HON66804.1 helix-turn-helix domain-containing protein [Phycisphaerae bacterium]HPP26553.1 helix-turn-helix domain-containing protein [Phycisphaerae bacterium]HPU25103.1 helix-turn-helix domain-containing protein [Phycisphaerae bacterium]
MAKDYEHMSLADQLKAGLQDSIAFSRGELTLKTTELPAPPPSMSGRQVARLRHELKMSQAVFAAALNVSPKTVQSWEQGDREPSDVALRMLQVMKEHPGILDSIFRTPARAKKQVATRRTGGGRRKRAARRAAC